MRPSVQVRHRLVGSRIRPVLRGTITISAGNLSATATLPYAVDTNHSRLRWLGHSTSDPGTGGTGTSPMFAQLQFTNGTTITAVRTDSVNAVIVSYEVIPEWPGAFRVLARGTVSTGAGSATGTATIPDVDITKAEIELLGFSGGVTYNPPDFYAYLTLTNKNTITIARNGTSLTLTAGFQVVERN